MQQFSPARPPRPQRVPDRSTCRPGVRQLHADVPGYDAQPGVSLACRNECVACTNDCWADQYPHLWLASRADNYRP